MSNIKSYIEYLYNNKCLVLDTETTGYVKTPKGTRCDVIEIGIVEFPTGKVVLDTLIYSDLKMNPYAQEVHKIQLHELVNAPRFSEVVHQINSVCRDKTVLAYSYSADKNFLEKAADFHQVNLEAINWDCILRLSGQVFSQVGSLTDTCNYLGIKAGNHRAKEDALAAARVLYRIYQKVLLNSLKISHL